MVASAKLLGLSVRAKNDARTAEVRAFAFIRLCTCVAAKDIDGEAMKDV